MKPRAYESAAAYIRKIRQTLIKLNRAQEWQDYLLELKTSHQKKRRLMEILSRFSETPLVNQYGVF